MFYFVGLDKIYATLISINLFYIPLFFSLLLISFLISALNIRIVLRSLGYDIKYTQILKYFSLAWSLGNFTPSKLGDFSLGYFLKKENVPAGCTTAILVMDRLINLIILAALSIIAINIFFKNFNIFILIISLTITFLFFIFFIFSDKGRYLIKRFILRKYSREFEGFSKCISHYLKEYKLIILGFFVVTSRIIVVNLLVYLVFAGYGVHVSFFLAVVVSALTTIISLMPVTINGLGTSEALTLFFYGSLGISNFVIASVSITFLIVSYSTALFFVVFYFYEVIEIKNYIKIYKSKSSLKTQ